MNRRSFISFAAATPLLRMRLWGETAASQAAEPWGAPRLKAARAEHQRVVLSFTPVEGAESYTVEVTGADGSTERIEGVRAADYSIQGLKNGTEYSFKVAAAGPAGVTPFSSLLSATPSAEMDWASLATAFQGDNPTRSSCPFWMVHGDETEAQLREFMRVIYRFGFEGVTLHPYDYQGFLQETNWKAWRVIVDEARKLGLTVWEQDDKDYPCGYAGGVIVAQDRKLARWEVTLAHQQSHHGPGRISLDARNLLPPNQQLIAVVAAALVIENMTQVIEAKLNGKPLGMRFIYPFRFDLSPALRSGSNKLELIHTERHTFTSALGKVSVQPFYEYKV